MAGIGDLVNVIAGHKVMPNAEDTYKNVVAPAVRIVTDTAIDVGDLVTGTHFHDDMDKAKKTLDEAGIDTVTTRIEENHYPEIKSLQADLTNKQKQIQKLQTDISAADAGLTGRIAIHNNWVNSIQIIQGLQDELQRVLEKLDAVKGQSFKITLSDTQMKKIEMSSTFVLNRDALKYTNFGVAGLSTILAVTSIASKSAQVAKLAGRASVVLMVVGIALDIGMAVSQLEEQKRQLQSQNTEADKILQESYSTLGDIQNVRITIDDEMDKILKACIPQQTEETFSAWADKVIADLKQAVSKAKEALHTMLVSALSTLKKLPIAELREAALAISPSLSEEEFQALTKEIQNS